jgi:hypothetical protein
MQENEHNETKIIYEDEKWSVSMRRNNPDKKMELVIHSKKGNNHDIVVSLRDDGVLTLEDRNWSVKMKRGEYGSSELFVHSNHGELPASVVLINQNMPHWDTDASMCITAGRGSCLTPFARGFEPAILVSGEVGW